MGCDMVCSDGLGGAADGRLRASLMYRANMVSEKGPQPKGAHGLDKAKFSSVATPSKSTRTQVLHIAAVRGRGRW